MRMVVGIDGSPSSWVAHELIAATTWPSGSEFLLVQAHESHAPAGDRFRDARDALDALAWPLRRLGHRVEVRYEQGPAASVLREAAAEFAADLIVVGSRGRGPAAKAFLGSVSADLADHASCPVLVARLAGVSRILLATDGSAGARSIPAILRRWHAFRTPPVEVLSVAPPPAPSNELMVTAWATPGVAQPEERVRAEISIRHQQFVDEMVARLDEGGWVAVGQVRIGDAAHEIVAEAGEAGCDLIITGSRGLGDLRRLLTGSVAHDVLLHSHASVLVMRGNVPARLERRVTVPAFGGATA